MNKILLSSLVLLSGSLLASEKPISFNQVQLGYVMTDHDGPNGDPDELGGFLLAGSYEINDKFYVAGEYNSSSDVDVDIIYQKAGVGYFNAINESMVFYGQLNLVAVEIGSRVSGGIDDGGVGLDLGIKSSMVENMVLKAGIEYYSVEDAKTFVVLGADYKFNSNFSAFADYKTESDDSHFVLGVSYSF